MPGSCQVLVAGPYYESMQADVLMDKRIVVVIDSWEADSMYPAGHYVRTLGVIGERATETEVCLLGFWAASFPAISTTSLPRQWSLASSLRGAWKAIQPS